MTRRGARVSEQGFTLIELLTVMFIVSLLLALSVPALRTFWLVRGLNEGQRQIITSLRRQQQQVVAETHPLVYGARFPNEGSADVRAQWGLVRFDGRNLTTTADDVCQEYDTVRLPPGVEVRGTSGDTGFADADYVTAFCRARMTGSIGNLAGDHFVFFFARGNATAGRVTLTQTQLEGRERVVCVSGVTGRVYMVDRGQPC